MRGCRLGVGKERLAEVGVELGVSVEEDWDWLNKESRRQGGR